MTRRGKLREGSQLSTQFQEQKHWSVKKTSQTDITQTDTGTYSNTDPSIAEMLVI